MPRGSFVILVALGIDGLQLSLMLALMGVVSTVSLIPFVGALAAPTGVIIGLTINICISLTAGPALLVLLKLSGIFYPSKLWPAFIKVVPFVNGFVPAWTIATVRCVMHRYRQDHGKSLLSAVSQRIRSANPADPRVSRLAKATYAAGVMEAREQPMKKAGEKPEAGARSPIALKSFDGIRKPAATTPASAPTYA